MSLLPNVAGGSKIDLGGLVLVERWRDFGWLDKVAMFTFCGTVPAGILLGIIGRMFDLSDIGLLLVAGWFSPVFLWLVCFWAGCARDAFGQTCGVFLLAILCDAVFNARAPELVVWGFVVACLLTLFVRLLATPLLGIRDFGRPDWAKSTNRK